MSEETGREASSIVLKTIGDDTLTDRSRTIGVPTAVQDNYDPKQISPKW